MHSPTSTAGSLHRVCLLRHPALTMQTGRGASENPGAKKGEGGPGTARGRWSTGEKALRILHVPCHPGSNPFKQIRTRQSPSARLRPQDRAAGSLLPSAGSEDS